MPKLSVFAKNKVKPLEDQAKTLYKEGLSTRQVGKIIGRSHQWVWLRVRGLSTDEESPPIDNGLHTMIDS